VTSVSEDWLRAHVRPTGPVEVVHERPWATVARVPVAGGHVFVKQCSPVQGFEPLLTARLARRHPGLLPEVIAHDAERGWLLLADAGTSLRDLGNAPQVWLSLLPAYAELQRAETAHVAEHLAAGVPDLRTSGLPDRFAVLLTSDVPLTAPERDRVAAFRPDFAAMCADLAATVPDSVQHDDLHHANVHLRDGVARILDWGDTVVSHPFASLVVTFQFLEEVNGLRPDDPWFARLRAAYLEPWAGSGHDDTVEMALTVGMVAHAIAWVRQRRALPPDYLPRFDTAYRAVLDRMLARMGAQRA
jgi:hypothetical protein